MKIMYVDLETTGLNPEDCDILQIGLFVDDLELSIGDGFQFECLVKKDLYCGQPYALSMHPELFKRIESEGLYPGACRDRIEHWMRACGFKESEHITIGGKNVAGFDIPFLEMFYGGPAFSPFKINHRVVDPGMLYFDPRNDNAVPGQAKCCERAGIESSVAHTALADCIQCASLVRKAYGLL